MRIDIPGLVIQRRQRARLGRCQGDRRTRLLSSRAVVVALGLALTGMVLGSGPTPVQAGTTVNLDQWASTATQWQNGNLNGNNSRYPEGGIVPFRLAVEGVAAGSHSIHINFDFTAGGHKAYDFLATWNVTNAAGRICAPSGGAISSMCPSLPSPSTATFPSDPFRTDSLSVSGAETYSGAPRRLTLWGGTITSISGPVHAGSTAGNSTADFLVRFRTSGGAALFAWGGHLAQSAYWNRAAGGVPDGASQVSGAPWHMRTLRLDGTGNKNQDRSIQPSAIVGTLPPFALSPPTPTPTPTSRPRSVPTPTPQGPAPQGPTPTGDQARTDPGSRAPGAPVPAKLTPPATSTDEQGYSRQIDAGVSAVLVVFLTIVVAALTIVASPRRRRASPGRHRS